MLNQISIEYFTVYTHLKKNFVKLILKINYRCRGTTKWVHQACIQRWIDEKQKGNTSIKVECPQCGSTYVIKFPKPTFFVAILDSGDRLIQKLCPIITGGVCVGSIYWTMVTFGAVTGKLPEFQKCRNLN